MHCPNASILSAKGGQLFILSRRAVHAVPGSAERAVLDLGQVVDAIMIGEGGIVQFYNLSIIDAAPRNVPHTDTHARYRIRTFGPWPSITILPNATVSQA